MAAGLADAGSLSEVFFGSSNSCRISSLVWLSVEAASALYLDRKISFLCLLLFVFLFLLCVDIFVDCYCVQLHSFQLPHSSLSVSGNKDKRNGIV